MGSQFVPDTAEGWTVLHQFFQIQWSELRKLTSEVRDELVGEFREFIGTREGLNDEGQSAAFHVLGHKGGILVLHFTKEFSDCASLELQLSQLQISDYLHLSDSYVSIVELGMYHTTKKIVQTLIEQGIEPHSKEWKEAYEAKIAPHKENLHERCFTEIPQERYICFYPMDKRRGDAHNWYREPLEKRAEYMMEHGMTGRRYAGKVRQVITGSIGFDDWEWGVDLFAKDPRFFKDLIYEMRFDDATSLFGEFGKFYLGVRVPASSFEEYFAGTLPEFEPT